MLFEQDAPIRIRHEICLFEVRGSTLEWEDFEFSDDTLTLIARSQKSDPQEARFLAKRSEHETDALRTEEVESDLLKAAVKFLRSKGKTEFFYLKGVSNPDPSIFYAPIPTTRPAV